MARMGLTVQQRRSLRWALLFISPWIVGFLAFTVYPVVTSFIFSFTNFNAIRFNPDFIGFRNYVQLFTRDRLFIKSLTNTLSYAGMLIVGATILDIFAAFLLNFKVRGLSLYRTALFLPVMTPAVASSLTWVWILNPKRGLINGLLARIGVEGPYWVASPRTALLSIAMVAIWGSGRAILIYLAGLKDVPQHLYEAAEIDGAGAAAKMWHITLPLLTPQMLFNLVTLLIHSLQAFTEVFIMTNGGPNNSTLLYGLHLYNRAFKDMQMGMASAMAWILFIIIFVLTVVLFRLSKNLVVYDR